MKKYYAYVLVPLKLSEDELRCWTFRLKKNGELLISCGIISCSRNIQCGRALRKFWPPQRKEV